MMDYHNIYSESDLFNTASNNSILTVKFFIIFLKKTKAEKFKQLL